MNRRLTGVFDSEKRVLAATVECRRAGFEIDDVYSPYPIHGIDQAMGLRPSRLTYVCLALALLGAALMLWLQIWTSAISWPTNIGGKPLNSLPAFIPVTFEAAVLFGALGTVLVMLIRSRLFPGAKPNLPAAGVTDDRFVLALRQTNPDLAPELAEQLLNEHGALEVREHREEESS
jgi:hypothetical protein